MFQVTFICLIESYKFENPSSYEKLTAIRLQLMKPQTLLFLTTVFYTNLITIFKKSVHQLDKLP